MITFAYMWSEHDLDIQYSNKYNLSKLIGEGGELDRKQGSPVNDYVVYLPS